MALLKIARMGHPVLAAPAEPVADPTAPEVRKLVADMIETMQDAGGTGIAAPQVHVPLRVVVFFVSGVRAAREDGEEATADSGVPLTVLCNPEVELIGEAQSEGLEACLSVPGLAGLVQRHDAVRYRGVTPEGETIEREAKGYHARVVQHECDHLDGILFPHRMRNLRSLVFTSELKHMATAAEQSALAGD